MPITLPLKTNAPPPLWEDLKSKPYVTVSSKGLANGLSDKINDGADFGPDTSNTLTSGIQEAINYIFTLGGGKIQLLSGIFNLNVAYVQQQLAIPNAHVIEIPENPDTNEIITIEIAGIASSLWDYQISYSPAATTPMNGIAGSIIFFNGYLTSGEAAGAAVFGSAPPTSANHYNNNVNIILKDLTFRSLPPTTTTQYQPTMVQLDNFAGYILTNVVVDVYTIDGSIPNIYILNTNNQYSIGISVNPPNFGNGLAIFDNVYIIGYQYGLVLSFGSNYVQHVHIKQIFIQYCYYGINIGNVGNYPPVIDFADIEQCAYPILFNNSSPIWLPKAHFQLQSQGAWSSTNWNNAVQYFTSTGSANVYGEIEMYITGGSPTDNPLLGGNTQYLSTLIFHQILGQGAIAKYPYTSMGSATAGTTAGSIQQIVQSYSPIQKIVFYFNGYENNTTTNQTISFLNAFSSFATITTNTTGLSLSTSLTGLTITAPNSTTTYSGIVIVEGY
ncbi:MAG: hypothetical protein QXP59_04515 [Saccharolobus sp.]